MAGANAHKVTLAGATLIIDTRSHKACSRSLTVARSLGFRITHSAKQLTLFTKDDKPMRSKGYRFMARINNPDKMIETATAILSNQNVDKSYLIETLMSS